MAIIRTLGVQFKAQTKKFNKDVGRASQTVGGVESSFNKAAAAAAAFAAVASAAFLAIRTAKAVDEQKKFADRIGISFEALQEFSFANEKAGNSFNVLSLGLQRMSRRIAEAANGMGEAQTALVELGLDAVKLAKLPLEDQFKLIADALEEVEGSSEKVRLAFKLFDSEGVSLINTIRGGSKALEEQAMRARELGIIVSTLDARGIEALNDLFTETKAVLKGIGVRILVELASPLKALAEILLSVIEGFNSLFGFAKDPSDTFKAAAEKAKATREEARVADRPGAPSGATRAGGGGVFLDEQFKRDGRVSRKAIEGMKREVEKQTKILNFIGETLRVANVPGVGS